MSRIRSGVESLRQYLGDLERREVLYLALIGFLGSGFVFAAIINLSFHGGTYTLMDCGCHDLSFNKTTNETDSSPITGDVDCNEGSTSRFLYHNGLFWVGQRCESTQVIMCRAGEQVGEYYGTDSCGEFFMGNIVTTDLPITELPAGLYDYYFG